MNSNKYTGSLSFLTVTSGLAVAESLTEELGDVPVENEASRLMLKTLGEDILFTKGIFGWEEYGSLDEFDLLIEDDMEGDR